MHTSVSVSQILTLDSHLLGGLTVEISNGPILHNVTRHDGPVMAHHPLLSWSVVSLLQVALDAGGQRQRLNVVNSCVLTNHKAAQVL